MTTKLLIKGTHCTSCKALLEDVCKETPGVTNCTVDYKTGEMIVEHDESIDWSALKKEINGLGQYRVQE